MTTPEIRNKDYISIDDKLYLAVVSDELEQGRVLSWLRYLKSESNLQKLDTQAAINLMKKHYAEYLFHSSLADNQLHGIPLENISHVYSARDFIPELTQHPDPDNKQIDALNVIRLLEKHEVDIDYLGITGSLLINAQTEQSDIDLLVYGRTQFFKVRTLIKQLLDEKFIAPLDEQDWQQAYQRRDCSLDFDSYCFHENRKYNKFKIGHTKVDISMIPNKQELIESGTAFIKSGPVKIQATVIDDQYAYDNPARYYLDHDQVQEVVVYTATYVGQAKKDERIEVSGILEVAGDKQRLVVGTSREAKQEYIKTIP